MIPLEPVLVAASGLGTLVVLAAFVLRGREIGWELSGEVAFLFYVRAAALAASVIFTIGLAEILRSVLTVAPLPPGYTNTSSAISQQQLIRGATFLAFGAAFWAVHFGPATIFVLRGPVGAGARDLYLAFLAVGATAFGVATVATLPSGLAEEAQRLFGVGQPYRANGTLGSGLAALAVWLAHMLQFRAQLGRGSSRTFTLRPPEPPLEPVGVGVPLVRPPDTRATGAMAVPPRDR